MFKKLTDNVFWGNVNSIRELKDVARSVICVANNDEMIRDHYSPLILPYTVPYFKCADKDRSFPSDSYFEMLKYLIEGIKTKYEPLLVHCYMGQHRSPIIAIMAAVILNNGSTDYYENLMSIVENLLPDFKDTRNYNYSMSAQKWMKKNLFVEK